MPSMSLQTYAAWSNYHLTLGDSPAPGLPPAMTIEHLRRIYSADVDETDPMQAMRGTASVLLQALKLTDQDRESRWGKRPDSEVAAGVVGRGWSFSPLIGTPFAQIMAEGLSWIGELPACDRHEDTADLNLCLCGGGTRLRELVSWAEADERKMSIKTSGTHLGPTVAGCFGTASHGSRIEFGGFQQLVHGMHIITGDNRQVWLQRANRRVLSDEAIRSLRTKYTYQTRENGGPPTFHEKEVECIPISKDVDFENALIHFGCMGVINAVAIELTPIERFSVMALQREIDCDWLHLIGAGKFEKIAEEFGVDGAKPAFYELTIDPQKPFDEPAAHLLYFESNTQLPVNRTFGVRPSPADAVSLYAAEKLRRLANGENFERLLGADQDSDPPTATTERALQFLLYGANTLLKAYLKAGGFIPFKRGTKLNPGDAVAGGTWGSIHADEISGGIPGALYNASYAIPLCDVPKAVKVITEAVRELNPSFVFTLRFVDQSAGKLEFTRFPECAVIEIDGLSRHICEQTIYYGRQRQRQGGNFSIYVEAALELLASTVERGAAAVKNALTENEIEFSMHWAKLGNVNARGELDAEKVLKDFGQDKIDSWRETRCELLTEQGQLFFRNEAAEGYGLLQSVEDQCPDTGPC